MKFTKVFLVFAVLLAVYLPAFAQDDEPVIYYQMEPLDDSLFIHIQEQLFIDPPDPKAEIIVDLRDQNNQTISIKGVLYPLLALKPETRARIVTYPFKIDLQEQIDFGSVFTRVVKKMKFSKVFEPPTRKQISSSEYYVNPFLNLFGGERFGIPIKGDIGLSFGLGTPYSGPLETNLIEANFHILGFKGGFFNVVDAFTLLKDFGNHNNIYGAMGAQVSYVLPFGNFFEVGYQTVLTELTKTQIAEIEKNAVVNLKKGIDFHPLYLSGSYLNWEFRYPFQTLGSTRAKMYVGYYLDEWHLGFTGRELSLAGSTFDLRFDVMPSSNIRNPQLVIDLMVQKIMESWAFSAFAIGPSAIFTKTSSGSFGVTSLLLNFRLKVGTSL